ncbi:MAG: TSUP family transporter [Butyricicoccus sp.]|nr:TSUP family transporter [Butyricicoccus sp.]
MQDLWHAWLIICPMAFLAGFVDAVAGGGGLISIPAYLFAGLPTHLALGSNKFAMSLGTFTSMVRYMQAGRVQVRTGLAAAAGALIGAPLGTTLALYIPEQTLKGILLVLLPCVAVFLAVRRDIGAEDTVPRNFSPRQVAAISFVIGFVIGGYDGLIGPGTGTFLILAFSVVLGYDLLLASGCAKIVNFTSNITSALVFLLRGKVMFAVAVPAAVCAIAGNQMGARLAVRGGVRVVRLLIWVVLGLLIAKTGVELLAQARKIGYNTLLDIECIFGGI